MPHAMQSLVLETLLQAEAFTCCFLAQDSVTVSYMTMYACSGKPADRGHGQEGVFLQSVDQLPVNSEGSIPHPSL